MKRLISLALSLVLLVGLLTAGALPASAATGLEPSEDMIALLKTLEGFDRYPRWDYSQWTVGYGTACPAEDLERLQRDGITVEEAEELLRKHLAGFCNTVNSFNVKYSLDMTQNEFDAVLLFTYNLGHAWMFRESNIRTALTSGTTGNDLMYVMGQWSHAGGEVLTQLVKRRLMEYNIYTNGEYSRTLPDNYCYVLYEFNGGDGETDVQCYDSDLTDEIRVIPTKEGYTFAGWYTMNSGGTKVTVLDASVRNMTLYARWVKDGEALPEDPGQTEPGQDEPMAPLTVTVSVNDVNIRSGPGTNYSVVDCVKKGTQMTITEVQTGTGYTWGKFDGGWIALMYTDYEEVLAQQPPVEEPSTEPTEPSTEPTEPTTEPTEPPATEPEAVKVMGTVTGNELCLRSGPGTSYTVLDYLMAGDRVEILEQKTVGAMTWGRIEGGWICMTYVKLDEPAAEEPPVTEPPATEPPVTEPPVTEPPVTEPPATEPEQTTVMGTVTGNELCLRSGPGTSYEVLDYLMAGYRVEILEQKTVGAMTWGRIEGGWICMTYVKLDEPAAEEPPVTEPPVTEPPATEPPVTEPEKDSVMGTVTGNELCLRSGPGTSYEVLDYLMAGYRVEILEQKTAGGMTWGRIDGGWISLSYVELDAAAEDEPVVMMVNADCLRIRSNAGLGNRVVGFLYYGAKVEVLETKTVEGMTWARINDGWVSMDYLE